LSRSATWTPETGRSLAGGSKFGCALLSVALLSNLMAIVLHALCARHGFLLIPAQLRA
jgi:Mn2+/Fe2+ NRAMP family transporter